MLRFDSELPSGIFHVHGRYCSGKVKSPINSKNSEIVMRWLAEV